MTRYPSTAGEALAAVDATETKVIEFLATLNADPRIALPALLGAAGFTAAWLIREGRTKDEMVAVAVGMLTEGIDSAMAALAEGLPGALNRGGTH